MFLVSNAQVSPSPAIKIDLVLNVSQVKLLIILSGPVNFPGPCSRSMVLVAVAWSLSQKALVNERVVGCLNEWMNDQEHCVLRVQAVGEHFETLLRDCNEVQDAFHDKPEEMLGC